MTKQCILWLVTASVFLITSTAAVPLSDEYYQNDEPVTQCAVTCPETSSGKFMYATGKTYEYLYDSDIKTSIPGKSGTEHSSLHMKANVLLDVVSSCEMTLRLTDVSLQDSDPTNYQTRRPIAELMTFKRILQDKSLSFAFIDGRIESVCPRSDDETWAINIRRGVVSAFQNTMNRLQGMTDIRETDVTGNCPVKYEVISSSMQTIKVKKTKDLLACTDRLEAQTIFQGIEYESTSDIKSMPLIMSTHTCEQEVNVKTRLITKITCTENHAFRPFAKWNSGAATDITYKLTFRRVVDNSQRPDESPRVRSSLLFDHTMSDYQAAQTIREIQQTFQTMCQKSEVDIRPELPGLFTKVVHQMRRLDTQTLRQLLTSIKAQPMCSQAEKFYRDALPLLGTTASVASMRQMIRDEQITGPEVDIWLSSLAFIKNPTNEMMKELKPMLESNMERAALPVSALVNTYCQQYDSQQSNSDVNQIMKLFEDELKYNCRSETDEQTGKMLTALRAIGNAGLAAQSITGTLTRCAGNDAARMSVRVAAVNAFRRVDCNANNRNDLFTVLENRQADSELRIHAYLAVMQCANEETLARVQTVLESDEVNQVLSFIWTHLTNLRETASPLKSDIRAILENAELQKEFDMDKRKFSRNIELSTFSELLNVGGSVESNLIWSGNSFVPRSASLNLTVDMFGQSINLFEVGGRIQGVEDLLEQLVGPNTDFDNTVGGKRERRAPIRDEQFNRLDRTFGKAADSDQLSYYLRVFGNTIRAGDIFQFDLETLKSKFNFLDWLIELAKDHNIDFTKSFHFLDADVTIPTGTGFPLRLNAEGSANIGLKVQGKVDIRQMFSSPSAFDISGSVKPSAAIEVRASMGIDGRYASTGLKIVNSMHSSTVLDGVVRLQNGRIFNFDWNLPQDKVEIFSAESHVYITYRDQDREQQAGSGETWNWKRCTNKAVADKIGLEMCGELTVPTLGNVLGPAIGRIYINKLDTYTGLHFDASYVHSEDAGTDNVRVSFNTPGSRVDHELTAEFTLKRQQREMLLNVKTPWKRVKLEGAAVYTDALKRAALKATLDDTTEYSITAELQNATNPRLLTTRFSPKMTIVIPDRPNIVLDGFINIAPKKYDVKLALKNAARDPITVEGFVQTVEKRTSTKYDISMQIGAPMFKGNLTGYTSNSMEGSAKTWASRAVLSYQYKGSREQIVVNHKFRDQSISNLNTYSTECSWTSTVFPRYNGQAGFELSFSSNSVRTKITAGLDDIRKVTITTSGAYDFVSHDKKLNGLVKLTLPYKDWDYEVKIDHIHNDNILQSNSTIKYGTAPQQQVATVDIGLKKESERPLSVTGEARLKYPGREMSLTETLTERAPREYFNVATVQWQRGQQARIESTYKMLPRHEFTNDISITGMDPIVVNGHLSPNLRNAQGRLQVTYSRKSYVIGGNWMLRESGITQFNIQTGAEFTCGLHGLALSAEVSRRDQEFTGNMEASYKTKTGQTLKYTVNGEVTATMTTPKFQIRVDWPTNNFIALTGNGKYESRGWSSTSNDLEGSLQLTSSVSPIEAVGVKFMHDLSGSGFKTNGEVQWSSDQKITGELNVEKARNKATLTLNTPFNGYSTIKSEGSYTVRGKSGTVNAKVQWDNGHQMVLIMQGDANQPERAVTGKVTFTSPFSGFENLIGNFRYSPTGERHQSNIDFSWARGKQVAATIIMTHQSNGWYMTSNGEISVTTPWVKFRINKLRWQHQNTAEAWKCKHEIEFDGKKYAVDVDTLNRLTTTKRQIVAKIAFTFPVIYDWLKNVSLNVDCEHDLHGIRSTGKTELTYGRDKYSHEHDVNIDSNSLVTSAKIKTPYESISEIGLVMNNRLTNNGFTANNELIMGSKGKFGLDGSFTRSGYTIDGTFTLTTPCPTLSRVSVNLRNQQQVANGPWIAHADVQYGQDKTVSVDGKLGYQGSQKLAELEIRTPFEVLRQVKGTSTMSGQTRNFQTSAELTYNTAGQVRSFTSALTADTADLRNMNAQLTINTPFEKFSMFKVNGRYRRDTDEHSLSTLSWELNRSTRGSANVDWNVRSLTDFNGKVDVEYTRGQKLELTTAFRFDPSLAASATFKSPFESARIITFSLTNTGPLDNFVTQAELVHNRNNRYTAGMNLTARDDTFRTAFRLTTPHSSVERVAAQMALVGRPTSFNFDLGFELNDKKFAETSTFQLNDGQMQLSGRIETPFEYMRTVTYSINHQGPWRSFTNNIVFNLNGQESTANTQFKIDGPQNIKFELKTPYQLLTSVTLSHTTRPGRTFTGWQNSAVIESSGQRYTGETDWAVKGKEVKAKAVFKIPEEYSWSMTQKTESPYNVDNMWTLKMGRHQIKKTSSMKSDPNMIEAKTTIETSFQGYERWNYSIKHEGPIDNFKTTANLETPLTVLPRVATELSYRRGQNDHSSTFKLNSPLPIRQIVATFNYRGPPQDMSSDLSIQLDDKTTTLSVTYKKDQRNSQGTLNIQTPYEELSSLNCEYSVIGDSIKNFQANGKLEYSSTVLPDLGTPTFSIEHSSPSLAQIRTVVQVTLPRGQVSGTFTHNGNAANFKTNLQVVIPRAYTSSPSSNRSPVTYEASIDHQTTSGTTPKTIVTIQGQGRDKLTLSKIGTATNLQLSAELLTSIKGLSRTSVSWMHKVVGNSVEAKAVVETAIDGWRRTSVSLNHAGPATNFQTTVEVETSQQGYEKTAVTFSNAIERTEVKTSAKLETSLPGMSMFTINSDLLYRGRGFRWSASAETPIAKYAKWSASLEHAPNNNGFRTSITASSPIQGWTTFGVVLGHTGDASQFQSTLRITTPLRTVPQIDLTLTHRGTTAANFNTTLTAEFGTGKRIETGLRFKMTTTRTETNYEGSAMLSTTVCPYFKDFAITASHNRKPEVKSGAMTVTVNGEQKVDFDYSYATTGNRNVNINIRNPRSVSTQMNLAGNGEGSAEFSWDQTKQVQFDFSFKDVVTATNVDRRMSFRTTVPHYRRTVGFGFGYTKAPDRVSSRGDLYWDSDPEPEFSYETEASMKLTPRREVTGYDGKFKVVSALFNTESSFTHSILLNGRQQKTEISLQAAETLTIRSNLNLANGFSHKITISHPKFSKDVILLTDATPSNFKTTLDYEQQTWTLEGSLVDESTASNGPKYSTSLRLANPSNLIDVQVLGDYAISPAEGTTNVGLAVKYMMSRDRQLKTLAALRTEINKLRNEIKIELDSPIDNIRLSTTNRELDIESGIVRYDLNAQCNHFNVRSTVDYTRHDRSLNVKLYSTAENYVEVFGQVISPTQMNFELSHFQTGDRINDAHLSLSYSQSEHLLSGRSYFSPELRNLAKAVVSGHSDTITAAKTRLSNDINQFISTMQADNRLKATKLRQALVVPTMKVVNYVSTEINSKADQVSTAFSRAYNANEFYVRDLHLALKRNFEEFSRNMAYKTAELSRMYNEWLETVQYQFSDITEAFDEWNDDVQRRLTEIANTLDQMQPNFEQIQPYLDEFFENVRIKLTELFDHVRNTEKFNQFLDKLNTVELNRYIVPPSQWRERLLVYADRIDAMLEELLSKPEVRYARNWLVRTLENNNWLYKLLGIEQQINEWIAQLKTLTWETLKEKLRAVANDYLQLDKTKWTVWDPRRGEYAFQIFIPFEMPDLTMLKRFDPRPLIGQAKNWVVKQLPSEDISLVEKLYALKPSSDPRDWVPPFKTHASLIGPQHYMTFDRRFFEFAGECSYLLARDFIGGTFSVVVNYDRPTVRNQPVKKSLTVVSAGRQIEVFPDGKVTADGIRIEMPAVIGNATVWRQGNVIRLLDDMRGVDVTCDLPHDHCTLAVSGWYYGKTAGLFGTYDNEPSNDFMSSDRSISLRPETTAESWTLGSRCRPVNRAHIVQREPETRRYSACAELFEQKTSMFRSCFSRVDPKPFMTMCLNDAPMGDNSLEAEIDVCKSASAYVTECRNMEMPLRMPKKCVRCEVPTTSRVFYELDTIRLEEPSSIPRAADVVFVIQHARCNADVLDKIAGLVDSMDKAMRAEDLTSARYAVVGFGGKKSHLAGAHVHTMDGQIFNSANKLALALDKFDVEGATDSDAMLALSYTARLPFRAGASKTIILVGCDACREGKVRYSDIQRILLNNDIHLHVLVQDTIRLKSKSPKTAYIYGVDQSTVYTRKDVAGEELTGEPDLRRFIRLPKDLCVALTQDTDGSIFSVRQWLDSRPLVQKQFVDVMVRTVARKSQPTDCQICECIADETQIGASKCRSCYHRDPAIWISPTSDVDDEVDVDTAGVQAPLMPNKIGKSDINTADETTPISTTHRPARATRRPPARVTRKPVVRVTGRPRVLPAAQ